MPNFQNHNMWREFIKHYTFDIIRMRNLRGGFNVLAQELWWHKTFLNTNRKGCNMTNVKVRRPWNLGQKKTKLLMECTKILYSKFITWN
jgi:hypothetical protein